MPVRATLKLAEEAMAFARSKKIDGSNNKWTVKATAGEQREEDRRYFRANNRRTINMQEFRKRYGAAGLEQAMKELAWAAILSGAGNCMELAAIAYFYLIDEGVEPIYYLKLAEPGDHAFLAIGDAGPNIENIDKWTRLGVYICDPWANIACKARNYKHEWHKKMRGWSAKNKGLPDPESATGAFIDPRRSDWFVAIDNHEFEVVMEHP